MGRDLAPGAAVRVRVPASSANLGPGFDSIGLALGLWDECTATVVDEPGLRIDVEGEGADHVPRDASHLVHRTMLRTWDELGVTAPAGLHLRCRNGVPHGRGLGSSATAIVTGIVAAQGLHDVCRSDEPASASASSSPSSSPSSLPSSSASERAASPDLGFVNTLAAQLEGHPDNSSASVFGGLTISWSDGGSDGTHTVRLPLHAEVTPVVVVPAAQLSTAKARSVLPSHVRHGDAALNAGRAALLVHALTSDPSLLLPATREWLHQEARRESFAASMALVDELRAAGHAAVISGAGPSVLVLSTHAHADAVEAMAHGGDWQVLRPGVPATGARVEHVPA